MPSTVLTAPPSGKPEAPAPKDMAQIFRQYDKNRTGGIEIDELRDLMADLGLLAGRSPAEASAMVVSAFTAADADTRDNALDLAEFAAYYEKATAPRLADMLRAEHPQEMAALRAAFAEWAGFGGRDARAAAAGLGTAHWLKLCRDTGLVGPRGLSPTDADLVFAGVKPRGAQRLGFLHFVDALGLVGQRLGAGDTMEVVRRVIASPGPALNATTAAAKAAGGGEAAKARQARRLSAAAGERAPGEGPGTAGKEQAPRCGAKQVAPHGASPEGAAPAPRLSVSTLRGDSGMAAADALLSPMAAAAELAPLTPDAAAPPEIEGDGGDGPLDAPSPLPEDVERVLAVFGAFASFGTGGRGAAPPPPMHAELDSKQFAKLCRDCGLVGGPAAAVAADLCFAKARPRGARRLAFPDFLVALALLAQERGAPEAELLAAVAACPGPRPTATTAPRFSRLHDDRSTYTGVYARGGPKTTDDDGAVDLAKLLSR